MQIKKYNNNSNRSQTISFTQLINDLELFTGKKQNRIKLNYRLLNKEVNLMYYVTMTDKFMSGWGMSKNLINKLIFKCDTYEEALKVEKYAQGRSDQKHINICSNKPKYYRSTMGKDYEINNYYVQIKDKNDYPDWYK